MTEEIDNGFIELVKQNYPKNANKILKAYEFAINAHHGVARKSGEPYIIHPVAVCKILIENNMDSATIMAGLLHDVVEDTEFTLDDIKAQFGETVSKLVDGVTKVDNLKYIKTNFTEADSIKRLLIAMGNDLRVIFIKLADRLHNMRTIEFLKREKQIKFAKQTEDLFVPIAERMGIRAIRSELQNLTFKCLHPDEYEKIKTEFDKKFKKHEKQILDIEAKINQTLFAANINCKVVGWPEHYYSIYKKLAQEGIGKIYGLMLYKIIVPTEIDCYKALGVLHKVFRHLPSQIKDFISSPKPNGYKSLHSVLVSENYDVTFKIMIRTSEMDTICEYGVSSLWQDKDAETEFIPKFERFNNLRDIVKSESDTDSSINFINAIKSDLARNVTWVFTPKFKPICLNSDNPTAIDFAYAVHTNIGHNAVAANINGKKVSLGAKISTGDVVEIILSETEKSPSRNWLKVATTSLARKKIREFFAKNTTPENVKLGKEMIAAELESTKYSLGDLIDLYPKIASEFNFVDANDMFASVGYKSITIQQLTKYLFENEYMEHVSEKSPVVIEGSNKFANVSFPKCCSAIPGDPIMAVMSKNNMAIHTKTCLNIAKTPAEKLLNASWKPNLNTHFYVNIKLSAKDKVGFGANVLSVLAKENVDLARIEAKKTGANSCEFEVGIQVKNTDELNGLIAKLQTIDGIRFVGRCSD